MAFQNTTNYQNWVDNGEVMVTLVMEEWCKGTPLDATIYREALYNNIHCDNNVEGLVVSFTWSELICMSFFEILMVV